MNEVLDTRRGQPHELNQILMALLTCFGFPARLVCALTPRSPHPRHHPEICRKHRKTEAMDDQDEGREEGEGESYLHQIISHDRPAAAVIAATWLEVSVRCPRSPGGAPEWVSVAATGPAKPPPTRCAPTSVSLKKAVPYIIALDPSGSCEDVTAVYSLSPNASKTLRLPSALLSWWEQLVEQTDDSPAAPPLPVTLAGFKNHPHFILASQIAADKTLFLSDEENGHVALFKGEKVYVRSSAVKLHSRRQWLRQQREVLSDAGPVRTLGGARLGGTEELFGPWQTRPYQVPAVQDGVIPTNAHGNIEVWGGSASLVPAGAALVQSPLALRAAKACGVYHVAAVSDFERRGERWVPRLCGAVVLLRDEPLLRDAVLQLQEQREEKEQAARETRVTARWRRLTHGLLTKQRLATLYSS